MPHKVFDAHKLFNKALSKNDFDKFDTLLEHLYDTLNYLRKSVDRNIDYDQYHIFKKKDQQSVTAHINKCVHQLNKINQFLIQHEIILFKEQIDKTQNRKIMKNKNNYFDVMFTNICDSEKTFRKICKQKNYKIRKINRSTGLYGNDAPNTVFRIYENEVEQKNFIFTINNCARNLKKDVINLMFCK